MICQKCQTNVQHARSYIFYYGNQTGKVRRGRQIITNYQIGGSEQTLLCHNCVFTFAMLRRAGVYRRWAIFFVLVDCALAIFALISDDLYSAETFWLAVTVGLAFAISLFLMGGVEKKRIENYDFASLPQSTQANRGSQLAIALREADLKARGFAVFFTPDQMKALQRKGR